MSPDKKSKLQVLMAIPRVEYVERIFNPKVFVKVSMRTFARKVFFYSSLCVLCVYVGEEGVRLRRG